MKTNLYICEQRIPLTQQATLHDVKISFQRISSKNGIIHLNITIMRHFITILILLHFFTLSSQENNSTIMLHKKWTIYDTKNGVYDYSLEKEHIIGGVRYLKASSEELYYRQEGGKIYCYNKSTEEERVILDFGLDIGDTFRLYDDLQLTLKQVKDTLVAGIFCKSFHLCGVEDSSYTDIWIEHVGSSHYGINPPQTYQEAMNQYLIEGDIVAETHTLTLPFKYDNVQGLEMPLTRTEFTEEDRENIENLFFKQFLDFRLSNDTLIVDGYIVDDCIRMYALISEEEGKLVWETYKIAPFYDSFIKSIVHMEIPGFTQNQYTIYRRGEIVATVRREDTYVTTYKHSFPIFHPYYDLQGRPVESPTRGIYIKDGRKVVIEQQ